MIWGLAVVVIAMIAYARIESECFPSDRLWFIKIYKNSNSYSTSNHIAITPRRL